MKKITVILISILICLISTSCSDLSGIANKDNSDVPETVTDNNGWAVPVYENVNTAIYNNDLFINDENGRISYSDDYNYSKTGIDVSVFQGDIDWEKVASDGIDFVILRAGCRGYGPSGLIYQDDNFEKNYKGATEAGLDIGVYFFSQAISETEAIKEAEFVLDLINNKTIKYPVAFDWEHVEDTSARTEAIGTEQVTSFAKAFCNEIQSKGYDTVVYFNCADGYGLLNLQELKDYNFWLAEYDTKPGFYYHYNMWQYTNKGKVNGITGNVDINIHILPKYTDNTNYGE